MVALARNTDEVVAILASYLATLFTEEVDVLYSKIN